MSITLTEDDVRSILAREVAESSQTAVAQRMGVTVSSLSLILSRQRGISATTAQRLGYTRKIAFVKNG